jgi:hypothetical protein
MFTVYLNPLETKITSKKGKLVKPGKPIKILYISKEDFQDFRGIEQVDRRVYELPLSKAYFQSLCGINIAPSFAPSRGRYGDIAYPNHLNMNELAMLFPCCNYFVAESCIELNSLAIFPLTKLKLVNYTQENLDGIESLVSLQDLHIDSNTLNHLELTQISNISLDNLTIISKTIETLSIADLSTIKKLKLQCSNLSSIDGLTFRDLTEIEILLSKYELLSTAKIPDNCQVLMTLTKTTHPDMDTIITMFPNLKIQFVDFF